MCAVPSGNCSPGRGALSDCQRTDARRRIRRDCVAGRGRSRDEGCVDLWAWADGVFGDRVGDSSGWCSWEDCMISPQRSQRKSELLFNRRGRGGRRGNRNCFLTAEVAEGAEKIGTAFLTAEVAEGAEKIGTAFMVFSASSAPSAV